MSVSDVVDGARRPKLSPEDEKKLMQAQRNNKTSE
jgi:hypothetical protein